MWTRTVLRFCILEIAVLLIGFTLYAPPSSAKILVGIVEDVTGYNADAGRAERDAGILCIEEWNQKGGIDGQKISYVSRDNGGDPTKAATIAKDFVAMGVLGALGGTTTTVGLAENSVLVPAQIPYMICSMSNKFWDTKGPDGKWYTFTFTGSERVEAESWIETALRYVHPHKRVVILYVNNFFGRSLNDTIVKSINTKYAGKMDVVGSVEIELKTRDASKEVIKVKALKPDVVLQVMFPESYVAWFRACNDLNYHPAMVAYWGLAESVYLSGNPKFLFNVYGYGVFDGGKKVAVEKLAQFKERFGYTPVSHWAMAWDAMNVLLTGIKNAGTNRQAIRDWIATKSKGMPLLSGNRKAVCRIQDGTPYFYTSVYPKDMGVVYIDKNGKMVWKD